MVILVQKCLKITRSLPRASSSCAFLHASTKDSLSDSSLCSSELHESSHQLRTSKKSDVDIIVTKACGKSSDAEVHQCLANDQTCSDIKLSDDIICKLLHRFKDDWKSALGVYKWAASCPGYRHAQEARDTMVDILGKAKKMDQMKALVNEMRQGNLVTLDTVAKVMRRSAGDGQWEDVVRTFDEIKTFGLEKNTESMNLLLDTLCKEKKVEMAHKIFSKLKSHIAPDAYTFNMFIHGWCRINRFEEAVWTIQEMKENGCQPCVRSYSTLIQFCCRKRNFTKIYELLDEMRAEGCPPNSVTYTTVMSSLAKSGEYKEALELATRMRDEGCKPDTLYYSCLIHILGRVGNVKKAVDIFEVEMPKFGVSPATCTYNSLIALFCYHRQGQNALNVLRKLENSKLCKPDLQTYIPLLKLCLRTGNIDNGLRSLLDEMVNKHYLSLDNSTYTLLIHGLCKSNRCDWAYLLFQEMNDRDIASNYETCRLLLNEVKHWNMSDAAKRIEELRNRPGSSMFR